MKVPSQVLHLLEHSKKKKKKKKKKKNIPIKSLYVINFNLRKIIISKFLYLFIINYFYFKILLFKNIYNL
jgi:hypothetical protein